MEQAAMRDSARAPAESLLMVVDDDDLLRESMAAVLTGRGFRVLAHASAQTALDALTQGERPDLILLDLMMPQMDGREFRRRQLAHAALAKIPVVAVSGDRSATVENLATAALIAKPLAANDLVGTVEQVLAQRGKPRRARLVAWSGRARRDRKLARRRQPRRGRLPIAENLQLAIRNEAQRRQQLFHVSQAMSHVVNNALQGLVSYAQCCRDADATESGMQRAAIDGALACSEILRKFADCTRPEETREWPVSPLEGLPLPLLESWRQACPPELDLRVSGLDLLARARIAPHVLDRIMRELISNAAEATVGNAGYIAVRITRQRLQIQELRAALPAANRHAGLWCCIDVSDQGCGIPAHRLQRIWWPFYSTKFAGRGLGLAHVLATMESYGGLVSAVSAPKRGTTVRLLLPLPD